MKPRIKTIILALMTLLVGCSNHYTIDGTYPSPLVEPLPVQLDLELDEAFNTYTYEDKRQGGYEVTIYLGEAQAGLFKTVTAAMFAGDENAPRLKMTPTVNSFQYSVPRDTRSEIYEVWLKYNVAIEEPDGRQLGNWVLTGYGKTPTATLKSQGEAINAAANVALRDVGTQLAIGFRRQPDVSLWLIDNLEASEQ